MSYQVLSPFISLPSKPANGSGEYPYLVVRLMASVYKRRHIIVYQGKASAINWG